MSNIREQAEFVTNNATMMVVVSAALLLIDAAAIWLGWNQFIHKVTDLPEISYFSAVCGGILKSTVFRGFGIKTA
jgi:hypothetical protein